MFWHTPRRFLNFILTLLLTVRFTIFIYYTFSDVISSTRLKKHWPIIKMLQLIRLAYSNSSLVWRRQAYRPDRTVKHHRLAHYRRQWHMHKINQTALAINQAQRTYFLTHSVPQIVRFLMRCMLRPSHHRHSSQHRKCRPGCLWSLPLSIIRKFSSMACSRFRKTQDCQYLIKSAQQLTHWVLLKFRRDGYMLRMCIANIYVYSKIFIIIFLVPNFRKLILMIMICSYL